MTKGEGRSPDGAATPRSDESYVFDNAGAQAGTRFSALAAIFDPGTIRHLTARGVSDGWHCLEVGAGGGSIATWLCERVGPAGHVVATDIDPRFLEGLRRPNLEVRRHDVASDPLPEGVFDLAHARLVLVHLPDRERALARILAALKPGGWLVIEEFDSLSMRPDSGINPDEVLLKTFIAMQHVMMERGVNLRYGRFLAGRLRARGLVDVDAEGRTFMWQGGSAGADLMRANFEQLRDAMVVSGTVTSDELDRDLHRLDDARFLAPSPIMWTTWGRRPLTP
jgi:SAM-dependent methyltransferase